MDAFGWKRKGHGIWETFPVLVILFVFSFSGPLNVAADNREFLTYKTLDAWNEHLRLKQIDLEKQDLDQWISGTTAGSYIPSAAVAVVLGNEIVYKKAVRSSFKRLYSAASFTKTFTAIAVLQLADRKLLSLDDPVSKFLHVKMENPALDSQPITVRHLLTHTSGLIDSGHSEVVDGNSTIIVCDQRYPAGYRFFYSNLGYNLLGHVVGKISGMALGRYITLNILHPLDMKDTVAPDYMQGSGGILTDLNDLSKYIIMLTGNGTFRGRTIISPLMFNEIFRETLEMPPTMFKEFRGVAWRVWTINGRSYSMNHAALWDNSGGWIQVFPSLKVGYVFMSDPPEYDKEAFYVFYRGMKQRLLKLAGLLSDLDVNPEYFHVPLPTREEILKLTGQYRNMINGSMIDVDVSSSGYLLVRKPDTGEKYDLYPGDSNSFVYIFPGQSERGWSFDFVFRNGMLIGLAAHDGYYLRQQ